MRFQSVGGGHTRGVRFCFLVLAIMCSAIAPLAQAQSNSFTDYTEYTYSERARGIGTFADYRVVRTFNAPIASLRLYIVSGRADDIGYVGERLVTNLVPMCTDVSTVTTVQEVTDQVTITGNAAMFMLRAQENCCCTTGWGSATEPGRVNARFRWEVTLGPALCTVTPLTPVTDPVALRFEAGHTIDTEHLTAAMQTALTCLEDAVRAALGTLTLTSAYRPAAYQAHLRDVWLRHDDLQFVRDPACDELRTQVNAEFQRHQLKVTQAPVEHSRHMEGEAFDANWTPDSLDIDRLAAACQLVRPALVGDPVHFTHR